MLLVHPQCRRLAPVLDELAGAWAGEIEIVKVDVIKNENLADRYAITHIPTLVLFDAGEERLRLVEIVKREVIAEAVTTALDTVKS